MAVNSCAYCEREGITDDHIPPKCFFPKPRASDLITVPCCERCREGWSKDDEYFRAAVLSSANIPEGGIPDSYWRSLERRANRGFIQMLSASVVNVEIKTEGGIYLGTQPAFKLDQERIDKVGQRIIRGLFFHENKIRVPEGYNVLARIKQFGISDLLDKLNGVQFAPPRTVQNGVFRYTFAATSADVNSTVWLSSFYDAVPFVGFTRAAHT